MSVPTHLRPATPLRVQYSLSVPDRVAAERMLGQLDLSLGSLTATHEAGSIDPVVVVHGDVPPGLETLTAHHGARIETRPPVLHQLREAVGPLAPALAPVLCVHKFLTLAPLASAAPPQVLLLDCDTVVSGDLTLLVPSRPQPTLLAREEIGGTRCRFGEDPAYLDEHALRQVTTAIAGHPPAPAFNTGVVGLVDFPWRRAAALQRRYLGWVVRFALWMALHPAPADSPFGGDVVDLDRLGALLAGPRGRQLRALAAPYPSANRWLIEEVAAWAAVGGEPLLVHEAYSTALVTQGAETTALPRPVVAHYFSTHETAFRAVLGPDARSTSSLLAWPPGA